MRSTVEFSDDHKGFIFDVWDPYRLHILTMNHSEIEGHYHCSKTVRSRKLPEFYRVRESRCWPLLNLLFQQQGSAKIDQPRRTAMIHPAEVSEHPDCDVPTRFQAGASSVMVLVFVFRYVILTWNTGTNAFFNNSVWSWKPNFLSHQQLGCGHSGMPDMSNIYCHLSKWRW